ncbi:MAG: hypothetical protein IPN19_05335 [Elusimicrobia bacterium]|nr:hypothetical protein [Elusimicrobiota bacterium]
MQNRWKKDASGEDVVEVTRVGAGLLEDPLLNKGSGFPVDERCALGLEGLLPPHVSTWEEQIQRSYGNYLKKTTDLERHVFLTSLQDRNETLFYGLIQAHIKEMMPIIYTPVVGEACRQYSHLYRRPRGFVELSRSGRLEVMLSMCPTAPWK